MPKKLTYEYVKRYFEKEGCELLDIEYINNSTKMKYIAQCKHINLIAFGHFKNGKSGRLCKKCAYEQGKKKQKLSYKYVKDFFKKEGCKLLEVEYINSNTKMKYIAQCGHRHSMSLGNFKSQKLGRLCLKCSRRKQASERKLSFKYVKKYFKKKGCRLLETKYINNSIKMEYIAQCGHKHFISFSKFKCGKGRLCPQCAILWGINNPSWNPNLTKEDRIKKRNILENTVWRKAIFKRDNYTCCMTNKRGGVVAHHLKPYYKYKKLRFEISNGITLNKEFHRFCHNLFGYRAEIGIDKLKEAKLLWDNK